jgi:hypothetical protein
MLSLLERYHEATLALHEALRGNDSRASSAAIATRTRCIEEYAIVMERWRAIPESEHPASIVDQLKWHHIRITKAESEVLKYAQALQDEVGGEIARLGAARKRERAYTTPATDPIRILKGEG